MSETTPLMESLIERFRLRIYDTDEVKNILEGTLEFTDPQIKGYILEALADINEEEPRNNYTLERFPKTSLLLDGAELFMFQARGLLHLRNQVSYSDAGFSVNLNDKSGQYQSWMQLKVVNYLRKLSDFKRGQVPRFRGLGSPMGWRY
jgi:hypothetical protein